MKFSMYKPLASQEQANYFAISIPILESNGDGEIRTHDPLLARQVLSQLSYTPK